MLEKYLTQQGKLYAMVGLGILALILILLSIILYASTGDAETGATTGAAGLAAAVAAAKAAKDRKVAQDAIDEARKGMLGMDEEITEKKAQIDAVPKDISQMSDGEKVQAGNTLLKG